MGKVGFTLKFEGFTMKFQGLALEKEGFTTKREILSWGKKVMGDYSTITSSVNNQPPMRPLAIA